MMEIDEFLKNYSNIGFHPYIVVNDNNPIPTEMDEELRQILQHPSVHQMLKYSFVGSKATVKAQVEEFLEQTQVNELIAVSNMYDHEDRLKSVRLFAELMGEINEERGSQ